MSSNKNNNQNKQKVGAYLRIRPFLDLDSSKDKKIPVFQCVQQEEKSEIKETEISQQYPSSIQDLKLIQNQQQQQQQKFKTYNFTKVFDQQKTNQNIFEEIIQPSVKQCFKGFNSTIFAYGQTASGKTHTIFGHKNGEQGIVKLALNQIFEKKQNKNMLVLVSFIEIYNEQVSDLLVKQQQQNMRVVEKMGNFYVQGCKEIVVNNEFEALDILKFGNENKTFGNSFLNDKSSRSHTIFKIIIGTTNKKTQEKSISELNFVDLAGSELLTDQFGHVQQSETKAINLSLFNLKSVIHSLSSDEKFIPYRNSVLTKLLQNSLGGNSLTSVICTIAPGDEHYEMSKRTIQFGQVAKKIENQITSNILIFSQKSHKIVYKEKINEKEIKINEKNLKFSKKNKNNSDDVQKFELVKQKIQDPQLSQLKSPIQINCMGNPQNPIALFLHGIGGTNTSGGATCMDYLFQTFAQLGYYVVAPDFPGYGESQQAEKFSSRITENRQKLIEFIDQVILTISNNGGKQKSIILGYDYGASAAMHYASDKISKDKIKELFIFHSSWNNNSPMEILQNITVKTNILWVQTDQFHPIQMGEKINKIIPNSKMIKLKCGKFSVEKSAGCYRCLADQIIEQIINILPNQNENQSPLCNNQGLTSENLQKLNLNKPEESKRQNENQQQQDEEDNDDDEEDEYTSQSDNLSLLEILQNRTNPESENFMKFGGACVRQQQNKNFNANEKQRIMQTYSKIKDNPDIKYTQKQLSIWAVQKFKELLIQGELENYYQAYLTNTPLKPQAIKLFGNLPVLNPYTDPQLFVDFKIWDDQFANQIEAINNLFEKFPKYSKNRQVIVKSKVQASKFAENYLEYDEKSKDQYLTHKGQIEDYDSESKTFTVKFSQGNNIQVPASEIYKYNQATNFANCNSNNSKNQNLELVFEDGVKGKYSEIITKAKLMEAALSMSQNVLELDYKSVLEQNNNSQQQQQQKLLKYQHKCVENIISVIDTKHLVHVGIDPNRYCTSEIGKLSYYGQGTCHILASVASAFLLPFAKILGLDVRYRAGSVLKKKRDIKREDEKNINISTNDNQQQEYQDGCFTVIKEWDGKPRKVEDHTWVEVTYSPSLTSYVVDTSMMYINTPLNVMYGPCGYHLSERLQCNSLKVKDQAGDIYSEQGYSAQQIQELQLQLKKEILNPIGKNQYYKFFAPKLKVTHLQEPNWEEVIGGEKGIYEKF